MYKEIKEKLRRQKERAKLKDVEKLRKHRRSNKSKSHSRHGLNKLQSTSVEMSPMSERKIKDTFRINMANVMVHFLNPYRKNDCKQGRITNTEDFKHLARKVYQEILLLTIKLIYRIAHSARCSQIFRIHSEYSVAANSFCTCKRIKALQKRRRITM